MLCSVNLSKIKGTDEHTSNARLSFKLAFSTSVSMTEFKFGTDDKDIRELQNISSDLNSSYAALNLPSVDAILPLDDDIKSFLDRVDAVIGIIDQIAEVGGT